MATINTNDLKIRNARNFVSTLTEDETNSFIFVGGVTPWENEEQTPTPINNFKEIYKIHNFILWDIHDRAYLFSPRFGCSH